MLDKPYFEQILEISQELVSELGEISKTAKDDGTVLYCKELADGLNSMLKEHQYNINKAKKYFDFILTHSYENKYPKID